MRLEWNTLFIIKFTKKLMSKGCFPAPHRSENCAVYFAYFSVSSYRKNVNALIILKKDFFSSNNSTICQKQKRKSQKSIWIVDNTLYNHKRKYYFFSLKHERKRNNKIQLLALNWNCIWQYAVVQDLMCTPFFLSIKLKLK